MMIRFTLDTYCPAHYIMFLEKALLLCDNWVILNSLVFFNSSESINENIVLVPSQQNFRASVPSFLLFLFQCYTL